MRIGIRTCFCEVRRDSLSKREHFESQSKRRRRTDWFSPVRLPLTGKRDDNARARVTPGQRTHFSDSSIQTVRGRELPGQSTSRAGSYDYRTIFHRIARALLHFTMMFWCLFSFFPCLPCNGKMGRNALTVARVIHRFPSYRFPTWSKH